MKRLSERERGNLNQIRLMTTAYLCHGDHMLLMQRSAEREFLPSIWSGVGGHVEYPEHTDLRAACRREIGEETGFGDDDVTGLTLRYVLLRQRRDELRQQFVYFGTALTRQTRTTAEGVLHWIPCLDVLRHPMSESNRLMLGHYLTEGDPHAVMVGVLSGDTGSPRIQWAPVSDWEA